MSEATAERLLGELGPHALSTVSLCIEECRRLDDKAAEGFWREVKARVESAELAEDIPPPARCDTPEADLESKRRRWVLMQKAELYRHRAMKAECAAGGSERHRREMIDLALQWFELARQYVWMAEDC